MKKEYSILIILSALCASATIGYFVTRPGADTSNLAGAQTAMLGRFSGDLEGGQPTTLPVPDGLFQVTNDLTLSPVTGTSGDELLYYHADNGFVSKLNINSRQNSTLSQTALPGLGNVIWSPDRNAVVTIFPKAHGQSFQYYNYKTHEHGNLPSNVVGADFSPDSNSLALVEMVGTETDILISDPNGSNARLIFKTHLSNITVSWITDHTISFVAKDDSGVSSLYLLSDAGEITKVVDSETGLRVLPSLDGTKILYSSVEEGMRVYSLDTSEYKTLPSGYKADYCAWYKESLKILCATDSQGELKIDQIALDNLNIKSIADNLIVSPEKLFLSYDEQFLIIKSISDKSLYALKIN